MIDTPQIAQTETHPTAIIRVTIPREEIQQAMGPGYRELMDTLTAQGIASTGPWYTHHLRMDPKIFDFEIGVPVAAPVAAAGRVEPGQFPATTVLRTIYHGPYEGLGAGWEAFEAWITAEGHTTGPDLWERYLSGPESSPDPSTWETELSRPLVR